MPDPIRHSGFLILDSGFRRNDEKEARMTRRDDVWIPAFAGMTRRKPE